MVCGIQRKGLIGSKLGELNSTINVVWAYLHYFERIYCQVPLASFTKEIDGMRSVDSCRQAKQGVMHWEGSGDVFEDQIRGGAAGLNKGNSKFRLHLIFGSPDPSLYT